MKKFYGRLLILSLINICYLPIENVFSQASWQWAMKFGGYSQESAYAINTDLSGNVYMTGFFSSPTITFGNFTLTNIDSLIGDAYLVKFDPAGNVLWASSARNSTGWSVCTDAEGNLYQAGTFGPDSITFGNITLHCQGGINAAPNSFLVKYDPAGNALWGRSIYGSSSVIVHDMTADPSCNIYLTGEFNPDFVFNGTTYNGGAAEDFFIAKYDSSGNEITSTVAVCAGVDKGKDITSDSNGNVLVTGFFSGDSITVGNVTLHKTTYYNQVTQFVFCFDSNLNVVWSSSFAGGMYSNNDFGIASDNNSNVYVASRLRDTTTIGNTIIYGHEGICISKFDSSGNVLWVRSVDGNMSISDVIVGPNGNVIATGVLYDSVAFGNIIVNMPYYPFVTCYVVTYDINGNALEVSTYSALPYFTERFGLANDMNGDIYVAGTYDGNNLYFGNLSLANGIEQIFIAKLSGLTNIPMNVRGESILLYPNPNTGSFNVCSSKFPLKYEIYDINGKILFTATSHSSNESIDAGLPEGIYILRVSGANITSWNRFSVVRKN